MTLSLSMLSLMFTFISVACTAPISYLQPQQMCHTYPESCRNISFIFPTILIPTPLYSLYTWCFLSCIYLHTYTTSEQVKNMAREKMNFRAKTRLWIKIPFHKKINFCLIEVSTESVIKFSWESMFLQWESFTVVQIQFLRALNQPEIIVLTRLIKLAFILTCTLKWGLQQKWSFFNVVAGMNIFQFPYSTNIFLFISCIFNSLQMIVPFT